MQTRERERTVDLNPEEAMWQGVMMLGGPVNTHAHLDRSDTLTPYNFYLVHASLQEKWYLVDQMKEDNTVDEIYSRMCRTTERLMCEGQRVIGSFIDVDPVVGEKAMKAADRLRNTFRGAVEFKFGNQVLKGVIDPEARRWFEVGAEWGDFVGALPGKDEGREEEHLEIVLETAYRMGKRVHAHVDQLNTQEEKETELLAIKTIEGGMEGRVTAIHAISLGAHPQKYREYVYQLMRHAGVSVITCPIAWINNKRKEELAVTHNAITPVKEMLQHGIVCAIGTDNIQDIYVPYNRGSIRAELAELREADRLYDPDALALIATLNGREVLGLERMPPKEQLYAQ